jgi:hypothetical protein
MTNTPEGKISTTESCIDIQQIAQELARVRDDAWIALHLHGCWPHASPLAGLGAKS